MAIACRWCAALQGLERQSPYLFETLEQLAQHVEAEHDMPVQRERETIEEAQKRFQARNTRAGGPECRCPGCKARRYKAIAAALEEELKKTKEPT